MTSDGVMRHPSFEGMREDKKAKDVKRKKQNPLQTLLDKTISTDKEKILKPTNGKGTKNLLNPTKKHR